MDWIRSNKSSFTTSGCVWTGYFIKMECHEDWMGCVPAVLKQILTRMGEGSEGHMEKSSS